MHVEDAVDSHGIILDEIPQGIANMIYRLLAALLILFSAYQHVGADLPPFVQNKEFINGDYGWDTRQQYVSDPGIPGLVGNYLIPPKQGLSPSKYIFWSPFTYSNLRTHPMILDATSLAVVWSGSDMAYHSMAATVQTCNGTDYITWWSGNQIDNWMAGVLYIVGRSNMTSANQTKLTIQYQVEQQL